MVSQGSSLGLVPSVTIGECRARPAVGPAPPPVACSPNRRSFEQCTHSPRSQVLGVPGHRPRASLSPATPPAAGAAPDADVQVTGISSTVPLAQGKAAPGPRGPLAPLSAQSQGHQGRVSVIPQKRELGPQGDRPMGGRPGTESHVRPSHRLSSTLQLPKGKRRTHSHGAPSPTRKELLDAPAAPLCPSLCPPPGSSPDASRSFSIYVLLNMYFGQ